MLIAHRMSDIWVMHCGIICVSGCFSGVYFNIVSSNSLDLANRVVGADKNDSNGNLRHSGNLSLLYIT